MLLKTTRMTLQFDKEQKLQQLFYIFKYKITGVESVIKSVFSVV